MLTADKSAFHLCAKQTGRFKESFLELLLLRREELRQLIVYQRDEADIRRIQGAMAEIDEWITALEKRER